MEYFIGIGVAYPGKEPRICERPFEGMVLPAKSLAKCLNGAPCYFQTAPVKLCQVVTAANRVEGGPPLCPRLRKEKPSMFKNKHRKPEFSRRQFFFG